MIDTARLREMLANTWTTTGGQTVLAGEEINSLPGLLDEVDRLREELGLTEAQLRLMTIVDTLQGHHHGAQWIPKDHIGATEVYREGQRAGYWQGLEAARKALADIEPSRRRWVKREDLDAAIRAMMEEKG